MIFHYCVELSALGRRMQKINEYDVKIGIRLPVECFTILITCLAPVAI